MDSSPGKGRRWASPWATSSIRSVLLDRCGTDAVRWYLLRDIQFGDDGDFQQQRFVDLVNNDLANTIGNLLNRTSSMARKWFEDAVPPGRDGAGADHPLAQQATKAVSKSLEDSNGWHSRPPQKLCLQLAIAANGHLNDTAPWSRMKQPGQESAVAIDLYAVLEAARIVGVLFAPLLPDLSARILEQLGNPQTSEPGSSNWSGGGSRLEHHRLSPAR